VTDTDQSSGDALELVDQPQGSVTALREWLGTHSGECVFWGMIIFILGFVYVLDCVRRMH